MRSATAASEEGCLRTCLWELHCTYPSWVIALYSGTTFAVSQRLYAIPNNGTGSLRKPTLLSCISTFP